jgi:peptidoglycan/xylan/chitin deacetylase (PgdA/CDA1 family)
MIGRIHLKHALKCAVGWLSVAHAQVGGGTRAVHGCILVYHRVAPIGFVDSRLDDWNVPPWTLERHLEVLCNIGRIIPLLELPLRLRENAAADRPWICLTFDDGYSNFNHHVLPVLRRYGAPATVFMPTSVIGAEEPMPFDRWACKHRQRASEDAWRPLSWREIDQCLDSGLVSIGSHSHWHKNGRECGSDELKEEAERSRAVLAARLGAENVQCYAYPYGSSRLGQVTPAYEQAVRGAGYRVAVTTDLGVAVSDSDLFRLPRLEAHPFDLPPVLRAKAAGSLAAYHLTDRLRRCRRT